MDVTVNWAVAEGQLQLNAFDPVMVHELLTGMALLTHAMETFRVNCVEGIEINADLGRSYAQSSPSNFRRAQPLHRLRARGRHRRRSRTYRPYRARGGRRTHRPGPPSSWTRFSIRFDWPAASARPAANARSSGIDRRPIPLSATPSPRLHQKRPIQ